MKDKIRLQTSSIFTKISFLTVLVVLLISALSTFLMLKQFSGSIHYKDQLLVQEATSKISAFFQDAYNTTYNQRTLLHSTGYISESIAATRDNPSSIYKPEHLTKITDYMTALTYTNSKIEDVILFTADAANNFSYSAKSGRRVYLGYDFNSLPYIDTFKNSTDVITAVYDSSPDYLTLSSKKASPSTITFIVKITDMNPSSSQALLGYLLINFSPDTVDSIYTEITEASDGDYFVLNNASQIIYCSDTSKLGQTFCSEWAPPKDIVYERTISLSGLQIIGSVSDIKLQQKTRSLVQQSVLITACGILFIICIIMLLHRHYSKKFQCLALAMSSVSDGDFSLQLPIEADDEIGYLSRTFNDMSSTLNDYINKNYLAETQRRTAELYALQAQINPHFLANTIESIRMKAMENDDYESSEMLKELGNLFRWMIQFKQDIVYIEDELEYIETYLDLQKFRFQDKLSVDMEIPSDIYYYGIPRFTLQPIVENALSHGSPTIRALQITISFHVENEVLMITIKDNGPGIHEDGLKKLNAHIHDTNTFPEFGVALRNIHTRIRILFGENYGLHVESIYMQGTSVIVTLPAKPKKELEEYVQTTYCG
ncbi:MAG: histidine kinase [Eubacteriales bacterium]|nr:histidine kinase [Eubacteriales bacterium]